MRTYVFFGPLLPLFTEESIEDVADRIKEVGVGRVLIDKMNIKYGNWQTIKEMLEKKYPELLPRYEEILFSKNSYFEELKKKIAEAFQKKGLVYDFCY